MWWLGLNYIIPNNLFVHHECWSQVVPSKKLRNGFWIIWHAALWGIWKARDEVIFNNGAFELDEVWRILRCSRRFGA